MGGWSGATRMGTRSTSMVMERRRGTLLGRMTTPTRRRKRRARRPPRLCILPRAAAAGPEDRRYGSRGSQGARILWRERGRGGRNGQHLRPAAARHGPPRLRAPTSRSARPCIKQSAQSRASGASATTARPDRDARPWTAAPAPPKRPRREYAPGACHGRRARRRDRHSNQCARRWQTANPHFLNLPHGSNAGPAILTPVGNTAMRRVPKNDDDGRQRRRPGNVRVLAADHGRGPSAPWTRRSGSGTSRRRSPIFSTARAASSCQRSLQACGHRLQLFLQGIGLVWGAPPRDRSRTRFARWDGAAPEAEAAAPAATFLLLGGRSPSMTPSMASS